MPAKMSAEYMRQWAENNRDKTRTADARRRAEHAAYTREWKKKNPTKEHAIRRRRCVKKYGLTLEQYDDRLEKQNGRCAICRELPPVGKALNTKNRQLAVDHCHTSKAVRGLLCFRCNSILGNARDSEAILRRCIAYLKAAR